MIIWVLQLNYLAYYNYVSSLAQLFGFFFPWIYYLYCLFFHLLAIYGLDTNSDLLPSCVSLPSIPCSVTQSCSNSLRPQGLQHARLPCPSPTPWACSNSCPLSQWCHTSSSAVPFLSCLQSFPTSENFPMSQFFTSGGQSIGVSTSASALPMNIQDWFPWGWTGWISL